jgi:hypothetical protein
MKFPYKRERKHTQGPTKCAGGMTMIIMASGRTNGPSRAAMQRRHEMRESANQQISEFERRRGYTKGLELKL